MVPKSSLANWFQIPACEVIEVTLSFLTRALATEVLPEAEGPAIPITWRVNQGGLYSGLALDMTRSLRLWRNRDRS